MKLIDCRRHHLEERIAQRSATWEAVRACIVNQSAVGSRQSADDPITVDVDHPAYPHPANQRYWPKRARLLATLRRSADRGVGDTAARCLAVIGAKGMADAYTLLTGRDCGCADRQRKLNERYPY